jgi:NAD(P)-dependent dehydrogenase (short-subunit alcohol dehydrogenase family)
MLLNAATFRLFLPDVEAPTEADFEDFIKTINALPIAWIDPIDVSNAVLFLASDESRYVTGTELKVDAGFTIK